MAANEEPDVFIRARVDITDPRHGNNVPTNVLSYGGKFYISAQGTVQGVGKHKLTTVWAKVYTTPQVPDNEPPEDPTRKSGYIDDNNNWYFYGSKKTNEDPPVGRLIEVSDPVLTPIQYLCVWGQMDSWEYPDADVVGMALNIESGETNSGDTEP